jgi:putative ABC transport system substrate-binding protein
MRSPSQPRRLVSRRPDVILVWPGSVVAARAAKEATQTIPIVLMAVPDVVEHGLVSSLRRPGSNVSGTSVPMYDLTIKQLQLLKEISPRLKSLVVIQGDLDRGQRQMVDRLRGATASLQLDAGIRVTDVTNVEQALSAAPAGTSAVVAIGNLPFIVQRRVEEVAFERRLPFVAPWRALYGGGGSPLISYGPRFPVLAERTASLIDRIVKGAHPQDLPMEEPTSYELIIDGQGARADDSARRESPGGRGA